MSPQPTTAHFDPRTASTRLRAAIEPLGQVVVGFSGGVDSTVLTYAALDALGPSGVLAVTAESDSLASGELEHCRSLAKQIGVDWQSVATNELTDERYVANDRDRCYWCKNALMDAIAPLAHQRSATPVIGVNVDDLGDHRPGQDAARARGARFPLVDAELTKPEIRSLAKHWDLSTWDRPAMPCLASRIPYGTPVTAPLLSRIDRAEAALRALGFTDLRVRHYDRTARIEVPAVDLVKAAESSDSITAALRSVGYEYVTLDLAGLRSGNLNDALGASDD